MDAAAGSERSGPREVHLVRHGRTRWSVGRRHTGRTDIPLDDGGEANAARLAATLAGLDVDAVFASPLSRARRTAELAGFGDRVVVLADLAEWDYGAAEGRTTAELREEVPGWTVWTHPPAGGESADDVGRRADAALAAMAGATRVLVFGHAHQLRILAARWCGLPAQAGRHLELEPAHRSVLGHERETPVIRRWNLAPAAPPA